MSQDEARARVRETNLALRQAAHIKARLAIAGTEGGADTRSRATRETMRAGQKLTVIEGADPLEDLQHRLTPRQWNAGCYLRDLWRDCLPGLELPGTYGSGAGHGGQRHLTADEQAAAARAWHDYALAMDRLRAAASAAHVAAVKRCVIDCEPAHPPLVIEALEELGRYWRMK